ncbi:MAG: PepSY-like domain-containing protein [Bacteroides sp.]|nr:PepSY-like domain-containing protein [Bacteroides sp.]
MKFKFLSLLIATIGLVSFAACSDDDDDNTIDPANVPTQVLSAFKAKYPNVDINKVHWETKGQYTVADYDQVGTLEDVEAWFKTSTGTWAMTETDYGKDLFLIPADINKAFAQSEYSYWTVDEIYLYEYPDNANNFYLFEVEKTGQQDMAVYFDTTGKLIKAVVDNNIDITPDTAL